MCKKLTKLAKENDGMKEELLKYRSLYGDLDSSLSVEELADSPHSREAELKVHLKLVEEEANILSRRIVELEVENRGLRAEMDDMKGQGDRELPGQDLRFLACPSGCGDAGDTVVELRRHLQFVEEEADLLRRSLLELEDQNKLLMNELNKYKSDHELDVTLSEDSCSVVSEPSQEELATAKVQISELSGKVKKLQYENRVLLSNLQRCDLASCQTTRPMLETDAEAGDSAQCVPTAGWRDGHGGEAEQQDRPGGGKALDGGPAAKLLKAKDLETLLGIRDQAALVSKAIDVLISDANGFTSGLKLCLDNECVGGLLAEAVDNSSEGPSDAKLMNVLLMRLGVLQQDLGCFMRKVDHLAGGLKEHADSFPFSGSHEATKEGLQKEHGSDFQVQGFFPRPPRSTCCFICRFSLFSPALTEQTLTRNVPLLLPPQSNPPTNARLAACRGTRDRIGLCSNRVCAGREVGPGGSRPCPTPAGRLGALLHLWAGSSQSQTSPAVSSLLTGMGPWFESLSSRHRKSTPS